MKIGTVVFGEPREEAGTHGKMIPEKGLNVANHAYEVYRDLGKRRNLALVCDYYVSLYETERPDGYIWQWWKNKIWTDRGLLSQYASFPPPVNKGDLPGCYTMRDNLTRWSKEYEWDNLLKQEGVK